MKRTTVMAALTGAAVLLAGCSSTSGTAAPASSSTSSAVATSSSVMSSSAMSSSAMSSSMAPASSMSSSAAPASSMSSSMAPAGSMSSSMAPASSMSSSEAPANSTGSSGSDTAESTASASKPPTTVGDTSGGLDVKSAAWFSAFCGGLQPVADIAKDAGSISGSDQGAAQKALVSLYGKIGSSFTATAAKLKPLPAPTFAGGEAFATKVVAALATSGPTFSADGKKLAAIDVKKDPAAFQKALEGVSTDLGTATGPLNDLNSLKLTPQTQAAFEKLPACAKLKSAATG